jgi:hypothetical protein
MIGEKMSLDIKWANQPDEGSFKPLEEKSSPLKDMIVSYVGNRLEPENDEVNVNMVVDIMAEEFPELTLMLAEENWIRGYEQGLQDLKVFEEE